MAGKSRSFRIALTVAVVALAAGCAATTDAPPRAFEEIRAGVETRTTDDGNLVASTQTIAEVDVEWINVRGRADRAFVIASRSEAGEVEIAIYRDVFRPLLESELLSSPWDPSSAEDRRAYVGQPRRETTERLMLLRDQCYGNRQNCERIWRYRIAVTHDDVRALLSQPPGSRIRIGDRRGQLVAELPRDELAAALDVLGVLEEYDRPAAE